MKKTFRTALIGAGLIANSAHLPAIQYLGDDYDVVGVSDIRLEAAQETAARFHIPHVYTDSEQMLREVKPEVVIVSTPNGSHKEESLKAIHAGAHVICEKPVVLKYADAVELFAEAEKHNVHFFPAQTQRFFYDRLDIKKIIDSGVLGEVYFCEFDSVRRRGIPRWGFFHMKEYNVGGPFCDLGVHELDYMLWTLGNPKVIAVSGSTWTKIGNTGQELQLSPADSGMFDGTQFTPRPYDWREYSVEDMAAGIIRLENGGLISFKTAWAVNLPDKWERKYAGTKAGLTYGNNQPVLIHGDLCGHQADQQPFVFNTQKYPKNIIFPGHIGLLKNVAGYLRGEEEIVIRKEETLNVTAAIEAFYTSAERGCEVSTSSLLK